MTLGIKQLQDALLRIGVLEDGYRAGELDEPTREAIRRVQRDAHLPREGEHDGEPDAETIAVIARRAEESGRFLLRGWVRDERGPLGEVRVDAEDRDISDLRERLGDLDSYLTDASGRFQILYTAQQFTRGHRAHATTRRRADHRVSDLPFA